MRVVTEAELGRVLGNVPGTPRVVASGNYAAPRRALTVLDGALAEYRLHMLNAQPGIPDRDGVIYETAFVGPAMRAHPRLAYFPCRLSLVPYLLRDRLQPDIVVLHTSRPFGGAVSLGVEVNILPAAIEAVRARGGLVIAQANAAMPVTYGDALVGLDTVDYLVEVDEPLAAHTPTPVDDIGAAIGERVAGLIPQRATLQLGIGAIPDATLHALRERRGLRVWSEMFSDGVLELEKAGCLDPDTPVTASFCFGSAELYDWIDRNQRVRMLRTEKTNDPGAIAAHPNLMSVNSALQVDLFAQANASRVGGRVHSGFGGQTDFIVGAMHSPGGHAIIALRSWHPKADVSAVVPLLSGPVTSFQHSYIVTEQGVAEIWGHDAFDQAQNILDHAAHPAARDSLREAGRELGLALH
ncbi:4-hydroxybutyrate CoA-transferase [Planosporangium thailandense]|uniref:4-hydroxybutyrate CoA-transferase n=1 Tax=Planosporangium thailandense TaxID=765197 RepID=A0ABX0XZ24_9ACTN|nr:acetyl-CoA hydrolase/transferase C-terminal domain-containing protein [Planosporangium thailandense]NJC71312.1 4-hydroxybutyrate CoA-transferase [Planosporangium thailandense]